MVMSEKCCAFIAFDLDKDTTRIVRIQIYFGVTKISSNVHPWLRFMNVT